MRCDLTYVLMFVVLGSRQHDSPLPLRGLQLLVLGMVTALSAGCMATVAGCTSKVDIETCELA